MAPILANPPAQIRSIGLRRGASETIQEAVKAELHFLAPASMNIVMPSKRNEQFVVYADQIALLNRAISGRL